MEEPCEREPGEPTPEYCSFHCSIRWQPGLKLVVINLGFFISG